MEKRYKQFKNPNCPAAVTARYAEELRTKRSLITGKPLTQGQLTWRSGILYIRNYEKNWHNSVVQKYGNQTQSKYNDNFMQHNYKDFDYDSLYDDLDNIKLSKK